jgi:hypothetical protein
MAAPYIPPRDVDLIDWGSNFAGLITATPAAFGLTPTDASTIQAAFDAYDAAYALAVAPTTRTPVTVADKNTAKFTFIGIARTYAAQIRLNPGVTNPNKTALGLNLVNNVPSPIPAPTGFPIITFVGATPGEHTLRFADSTTPDSKAKPQGVTNMQLFVGVSTIALVDPADCSLYSTPTRVPLAVTFNPADAGKLATYFGRWATRKGLVGPWSAAVSAVVPGL